jgi:hypothetical protein
LSSEEALPAGAGDSRPECAHDPHFALTLPQLQRLYMLNRAELVRSANSGSLNAADAHEVVQSAFARAAKIRFSFRNERQVITWLRSELGASAAPVSSEPDVGPRPPSDWDDVLQRARITTPTGASPSD